MYANANVTHLTVDWGRNVHAKKGKYRTHKTSHARKRVNLSRPKINPDRRRNQSEGPMTTDPYRPSIGEMAPKDLPFVVESGEEFPPGHHGGRLSYVTCRENGEDSQEDTIHSVPELHLSPCQKNQIIGFLVSRTQLQEPTHIHPARGQRDCESWPSRKAIDSAGGRRSGLGITSLLQAPDVTHL